MRSYEDLFEKLECVRCGSRERLIPYEISKVVDTEVVSRRKRSTTYLNTTARVKLPICSNCNLEFQRWKKFNNKNRWSYGGALCYGVMAVLIFLLAFITGPDASGFSPLLYVVPLFFVPIGIFSTHAILISYTASKLENNPKHSIKFIGNEAHVKPMNTFSWISYQFWMSNTLKDSITQNIEQDFKSLSFPGDIKMSYEYCPKCHTKLDKDYKFCVECGERLN